MHSWTPRNFIKVEMLLFTILPFKCVNYMNRTRPSYVIGSFSIWCSEISSPHPMAACHDGPNHFVPRDCLLPPDCASLK